MTLEDSVRRHRLAILQRAALLGNVTQVCHEAGISRTVFYRWRQRFLRYGPDGLLAHPLELADVEGIEQRREGDLPGNKAPSSLCIRDLVSRLLFDFQVT